MCFQLHEKTSVDLSENLAEFKKFNGLRKFRNAARLVILTNRLRSHDANDLELAASTEEASPDGIEVEILDNQV
jgi:hypothetical protein